MPKRSSNEPDINQLAAAIVEQTTNGDAPAHLNGKNPAAVALESQSRKLVSSTAKANSQASCQVPLEKPLGFWSL
jgi:hypothetical protein